MLESGLEVLPWHDFLERLWFGELVVYLNVYVCYNRKPYCLAP